MYIPAFNQVPLTLAQALLERYDFGAFITVDQGTPSASHLPFLYSREPAPWGTLIAHLARANPQSKLLESSPQVFVVVQGPHGYVSPSWYRVHPSVPTWNYVAVHAAGRARVISEPARVRALLGELVHRYESPRAQPWKLDLPEAYLQGMTRQIVAFEVELTSIEGKLKLSQNRTPEEQLAVIEGLEASEDPLSRELGQVMREFRAAK